MPTIINISYAGAVSASGWTDPDLIPGAPDGGLSTYDLNGLTTGTIATGLAEEIDTALETFTITKTISVGIAAELNEALTVANARNIVVGLAMEIDSIPDRLITGSAFVKIIATGRADEIDLAFAINQSIHTGLATETDTAITVALVGGAGETGWTAFQDPISYGAKTVYLAPQTGSDSFNGLTESTPKLTWNAAYALVLSGAGDHLLIKRGETLNHSTSIALSKAGASAARRMVIGPYGSESLARPIINFTGTQSFTMGFFLGGNFARTNYVAITHLHLKRAGGLPPNASAGVVCHNSSDFLLEGCRIENFSDNCVVEGNPHEDPLWRVARCQIRRNVIVDSFDPGDDRSQGIFIDDTDNWLIEENILDDNGVDGSIFARNCYNGDKSTDGLFTGNVSHNSASEGLQQRGGGTARNNLFMRNSYNMTIGLNFTVAAIATYNVIIDSKNISAANPRGSGILLEPVSTPAVCTHNCILFNVQGTGLGSVNAISWKGNAGTIAHNFIYDWHDPIDPESRCILFQNGSGQVVVNQNSITQTQPGILIESAARSPSTLTATANTYGHAGGLYDPFRPYTWVTWQAAVGGGEAGSSFGAPAAAPCSPATPDGMMNAVAGMGIAAYMTTMRTQRKGAWSATLMPYALNNEVRDLCGVPNP